MNNDPSETRSDLRILATPALETRSLVACNARRPSRAMGGGTFGSLCVSGDIGSHCAVLECPWYKKRETAGRPWPTLGDSGTLLDPLHSFGKPVAAPRPRTPLGTLGKRALGSPWKVPGGAFGVTVRPLCQVPERAWKPLQGLGRPMAVFGWPWNLMDAFGWSCKTHGSPRKPLAGLGRPSGPWNAV